MWAYFLISLRRGDGYNTNFVNENVYSHKIKITCSEEKVVKLAMLNLKSSKQCVARLRNLSA